MPTLYKDMISGSKIVETEIGYIATRLMIIDGLSGPVDAMLWTALQFQQVPARNTFHPTLGGLVCYSREASPIAGQPTQALITLMYGQVNSKQFADNTKPCEISVGSTIQSAETNVDVNGDNLVVTYDVKDPTTNQTVTKKQTGKVSIDIPQTVVRLTRREKGSPLQKSIAFVGTVNRDSFLGNAKACWLCTRIEGQTDDGGVTYMVTYEFQLADDNWNNQTIVYIDPTTNLMPEDADFGNGKERYDFYMEADFSILKVV